MASRAAAVLNRVIRATACPDVSDRELLHRFSFLPPCFGPSSYRLLAPANHPPQNTGADSHPGDTYRQIPPAPEAPP
jgi:hypothetical protein